MSARPATKKAEAAEGLASLLLLPVNVVVEGWVLSRLWDWFVTPLGAPPIGIAHAAALAMLATLTVLRTPRHTDDRTAEQRITDMISYGLVTPLLSLCLGWVLLQVAFG